MSLPTFKKNNTLTYGIELELQIIDQNSKQLAMESVPLMDVVNHLKHPGEFKFEITQSMIEFNSSVHSESSTLHKELLGARDALLNAANQLGVNICGGGTHPFSEWTLQEISTDKRYKNLFEQYGYLAKQFTIFGQHIHIACPDADDALYVCHALVPFIPHFIALSASSPFCQGADSKFNSSRILTTNSFPTSGHMPWIFSWTEFEKYFERLHHYKMVSSMKDFYWDIRPKPEFGTVELRICDTPLHVTQAAYLADYARLLVDFLLHERKEINPHVYMPFFINRFRAARYGFDAEIIDVNKEDASPVPLDQEIIKQCDRMMDSAQKFNCVESLNHIKQQAMDHRNDANTLREIHDKHTFEHLVQYQIEQWKS